MVLPLLGTAPQGHLQAGDPFTWLLVLPSVCAYPSPHTTPTYPPTYTHTQYTYTCVHTETHLDAHIPMYTHIHAHMVKLLSEFGFYGPI